MYAFCPVAMGIVVCRMNACRRSSVLETQIGYIYIYISCICYCMDNTSICRTKVNHKTPSDIDIYSTSIWNTLGYFMVSPLEIDHIGDSPSPVVRVQGLCLCCVSTHSKMPHFLVFLSYCSLPTSFSKQDMLEVI
jgi:hypothetical protein